MKTFYRLLGVALVASTTNNFVWFALTYWAYLSTHSVISTGMVGGMYLVASALSSFWFGSLVDHYKKKQVMVGSGITTFVFFVAGFVWYSLAPAGTFASVTSISLWMFVLLLLCGSIAGNIYGIAIPTLVTSLVPADRHDKANGMFGTVMGVSFAITSVASGFTLAFGGMGWVLGLAVAFTVVAIVLLGFTSISEKKIIHAHEAVPKRIDIRGTIKVIRGIPGLFALIFFTTFNNFVGGVFMALMDAYGLSLMSVAAWGTLWGFLSFGFIFGGLYIARKGLGKNPLATLFRVNGIIWATCIFFPIQPSILLLTLGSLIWMTLVPFIEATEQTIIQKVVPPERQGRVFGFAHSIEQAASPFTAFLIGPIAQFIFIPFMTSGRGTEWIGGWFGTGEGRGIALVFIAAGIVGLLVTFIAQRSKAYTLLAMRYGSDSHA